MTAKTRMSGSLDEAFRAALLLTGHMDAAEAAVLDGIAALEPGDICAGSLLEETAKCSIQLRDQLRERSDRVTLVPPELQRLLLLDPVCRDCFVLRVLIGLTPPICFGILRLSEEDFENAVHTALQDLPVIARCTPESFSRRQLRQPSAGRPGASSNSPKLVGVLLKPARNGPGEVAQENSGSEHFSLDGIPTTRYDTN